MKAQMRAANRQKARFTVIVGKDELAAQQVQVKDMETGEQVAVSFDVLTNYLNEKKSESLISTRGEAD